MQNYLKTTIVAKVVMAITGIILIGFLFGHALGNLQFLLGTNAYNSYAELLQSNKELLWILRISLIVCVVLHIISAVYLRLYNNAAKPIKYQVKNYLTVKLTARTMLWTGLLIVVGLTYHLLHFTTGDISFENGYDNYEIVSTGDFAVVTNEKTCTCKKTCTCEKTCCNDSKKDCSKTNSISTVVKERHDVHTMVSSEFNNPFVAISYIIFVALVGFHLNHAIQSAFQTIGIQGPKLSPFLRKLSVILSIVLVLLFITLPITVMLGLAAGGCC